MLLAFLLATAVPEELPFKREPDFNLTLNGTQIPIYCDENQVALRSLLQQRKAGEKQTRSLRAKRKANTLTFKQSGELYAYDLALLSVALGIVTREHAAYLCLHPEEWPQNQKELGI